MPSKRILVVEDDPAIFKVLKDVLANEGFESTWVELISEARKVLKSTIFSAIILDVKLPDGNGFTFCKEIKQNYDIPVIFLTAQNTEADILRGLDIGDDYVEKPFKSITSVARRIKNIIKREEEPKSTSRDSKFDWDDDKKIITYKGKRLTLAPLEKLILRYLIMRPGRVISREEFIDNCWPVNPNIKSDKVVDVYISNIRNAIKDIDPKINKFQIITTRSKEGFMLKE